MTLRWVGWTRGLVITGGAPGDRISAVNPAAPPPYVAATHWPAPVPAASDSSGGWFYSLLTQAGATPSTARSVNDFVVRPLEVVLVVVVAALVAHFGARAIRRVLGRMATQAAGRTEGRPAPRVATLVALISNLWRLFVAVVAIAIVLGMLGINLTPLLASATIIGATIGFGAQSLVRDYLSGILLAMEDQFGIGDTIAVGATTGVVEDVSLRVTRMRAADGSVCYVPNGEIRQLTNSSRGWAKAMVDVPVAPGRHRGLRAGARGGGRRGTRGGALAALRRFLHRAARGGRHGGRRRRQLHRPRRPAHHPRPPPCPRAGAARGGGGPPRRRRAVAGRRVARRRRPLGPALDRRSQGSWGIEPAR